MRKSVLVAAMVLVLAGCRRDVQSIDEPAPTATTVARVGLAEPSILNRHGDGYGETRAHSIVEPTPTAKSQADASRNLSLGESDSAVQETKTAEPVRASQADESRNLSLGGSDEPVQETKTVEPVRAAQADASRNLSLGGSDEAVQETKTAEPVRASQADASRNLSLGGSDEAVQETKTVEPLRASQADESRNLSLGGSDNAVQETKTAEPVSAADPVWAPMPRGPEAKTTKSIDRPKFTGCPPGAEMSRRSRMKAAASHGRAPAQMARVGRPHHRGWSVARIVATL